tara:strand:+ start:4205 stop:4894 length:690 start_codon:yes stop_codon:yes gene_type:complete
MENHQNVSDSLIQTIAIDGPVASGKSTVGQIVAQNLRFQYLDTGVMYRAVAWLTYFSKIDLNNHSIIEKHITENPIQLLNNMGTQVQIGNTVLESELRSPLIEQSVSDVSKISIVRELLVKQQRDIANQSDGIVMVGRDIGSVVLTNADLKIYLDASIEKRAQRRILDRIKMGSPTTLPDMMEEIRKRDFIDTNRENSPLTATDDAIIIDTDSLDQTAVANLIVRYATT